MQDQTRREAPSVDELWTAGRLLLDSNDDGYVDDVAARIVLDGSPSREVWAALFDLAARVGLETSGLTFPLVTGRPEEGQLPIVVSNGNAEAPEYHDHGWQGGPAVLAAGPKAVRTLALGGSAEESAEQPDQRGHWAAFPDLSRLFGIDMLLDDTDGDRAPDGTHLCIVVPDALPDRLGSALIDLCARAGLESGGVDFPVATTGEPLRGLPLLIELGSDDQPARLELVNTDTRFALRLTGNEEQAAKLISLIAESWPEIRGSRSIADVRLWLRQALAGWIQDGRAASLIAELEAGQPSEMAEGSTLRLLVDDPEERRELIGLLRRQAPESLEILKPGDAMTVFDQQWDTPWEGQRIVDILRDNVLPKLDPIQPLQLTLVVSEPPETRHRVLEMARVSLVEAGFDPSLATIRVLDAFKPGLCWITEGVLPRWRELGDLDRVRITFKQLETNGDDNRLDLSIRWLQELFPVDEIIARELALPLDRIILEASDGDDIYTIEALNAAGDLLAQERFSPLFRRQPYLEDFPQAGQIQVTTGGIIAAQGETEIREPVPTDPEAFWHFFQTGVLARVGTFILEQTNGEPCRDRQPFFDELRVELTVSESDEPYGIREERHSAAEALHEDIYFNALDYIETLGVETTGERLSAPGQVVPIVRVQAGVSPHASVRLQARASSVAQLERGELKRPIGRIAGALPSEPRVTGVELDGDQLRPHLDFGQLSNYEMSILIALAELHPPRPERPALEISAGETVIRLAAPEPDRPPAAEPAREPAPDDTVLNGENLPSHLARLTELPGVTVRLGGRSFQGRPLPVIEVTAPSNARVQSPRKLSRFKPTFLVAARHHANEVASTTAALWLVERLASAPDWKELRDRVNVVVVPNENADGTELHRMLMAEHPSWK
ncbi:MAG TPA: M14 family zinc carboxypeptidase, partial [Thermomicrobiaceae bacterium]|nr:M14 family zinc carboxypeptidase [Thermomicrobiaceae bacterium]